MPAINKPTTNKPEKFNLSWIGASSGAGFNKPIDSKKSAMGVSDISGVGVGNPGTGTESDKQMFFSTW